MATILPTYDWTRASAHIENARSRAYPWEEWLDGQIRKLDRGADFDGPSMSVERVIRTSANRRGIRVRIRVEGESIYLQAHQEDARNKARGVTKSATKKAVKEAQAAKKEGRGNGVAPSTVITPKPATTRLASRASKPVTATVTEAPATKPVARKRTVKTTPVPVVEAPVVKATPSKTNGKAKSGTPGLAEAASNVARTVRKALVKA